MAPTFEYALPTVPTDPVSALAFNPSPESANQLLVASWDKNVRLFHLPDSAEASSSSTPAESVKLVHTFPHDAPVLDVCWINDKLAASGGLDRRVRLLNLETGQSQIIGKHGSAVNRIRFSQATGLLLSSSWDATLSVWDPLAAEPTVIKTLTHPEKILAIDVAPPYSGTTDNEAAKIVDDTPRLVVGMTGRLVHIYNISQWSAERRDDESVWKPEQKRESSLKFMLRDIRCMPSGTGRYAGRTRISCLTCSLFLLRLCHFLRRGARCRRVLRLVRILSGAKVRVQVSSTGGRWRRHGVPC